MSLKKHKASRINHKYSNCKLFFRSWINSFNTELVFALSTSLILQYINSLYGEGNGNPLQYSCLGNPMDRGAWRATVHGVARSQMRLNDFTFMHWRRKWQPTPVFLPGESQEQKSLVSCYLWGHTESNTT